ncbi:MAG: proteinase inhibitor [Deltaproteobacteria bacterium]|nr:proteinase inhibitor [Deltaproteobacteria bacterium]
MMRLSRTRFSQPLWASLLFAPIVLAMGCGRPSGIPEVPAQVIGSCTYRNMFSGRDECKDFLGSGWTAATVTADCSRRGTTANIGVACDATMSLGQCIINAGRPEVNRLTFPGTDATQCGSTQNGCEFWGGGVFVPNNTCGGSTMPPPSAPSTLPIFQQPTQACVAPRAGEPAGTSAEGRVCTWSAISGCTEQGRKFGQYGTCDRVLTQRPYWPARPAPARRETPDPRLQNPTYAAELGWVRSQIESCACVCCHSDQLAPRGPSNWFVESAGNFMDSFHDSGLALGAGWIDSTSFGAYPPAENNGFSRTTSGFPATDPARMARFFADELQNRGRTRESFAEAVPFGGPIYTQQIYRPTACTQGEGVARDGTVTWTGGNARYVYVLSPTSTNPGVPPNLDTPAGTQWRVDVPFDGTPIASGIRYGVAPMGTTQRVPADTAPMPLVAGQQYYLYVLQDVGIPVTRCLFTGQ